MSVRTAVVLAILVVIGVGVFCAYQPSEAQSSVLQEAGKVGVVDVAMVLQECQEYKDREKASVEKRQELNAKLEELAAKADAVRQELENALQPDSKEYSDRLQEWFDLQAMYKARKEGQVLAAETQAWTEALYQKLLDEVARVADQQQVPLVLTSDSTPVKSRNMGDLIALIRTRSVLFRSPRLDLTNTVLENMDRAYRASQVK